MINLQESLRQDVWNAIKKHYESEDYTEALRDAAFLLKDILQNKSGEFEKDNSKLVEAVLLGNNPAIKLNNYSTQSEKDFQIGIANSMKGIFMHVRNPISHEKVNYTLDDANVILLYIDYLIKQIDKSYGASLFDEWLPLLKDKTFTDTEEYAKELIKELPKKKTLELLLAVYRERTSLPQYRLFYFIKELISALTSTERNDFILTLNENLARTSGGYGLSMFFHYFADSVYTDLKKVVKLRIEDVVYHGIESGEVGDTKLSENAAMATWANNAIDFFETKTKVVTLIQKQLWTSSKTMEYVCKFFYKYVDITDEENLSKMEDTILSKFKFNGQMAYDFICRFVYDKTDELYLKFKDVIDEYEEKNVPMDERIPEDLPF